MSFSPEHWPALPRDCETGQPLEVAMVFPEVGYAVKTVWQLSFFSRPFCIDAITFPAQAEALREIAGGGADES